MGPGQRRGRWRAAVESRWAHSNFQTPTPKGPGPDSTNGECPVLSSAHLFPGVCGSLFSGLPASTLPPPMPGLAPPCLPVSILHCDFCCGTSELPKSLKSCGSSSKKVIQRPLLIHTHLYPLQAPEFSECEADGLLASCQADLMLHAQSQPGPKGTCVPRPVRSPQSLSPPF